MLIKKKTSSAICASRFRRSCRAPSSASVGWSDAASWRGEGPLAVSGVSGAWVFSFKAMAPAFGLASGGEEFRCPIDGIARIPCATRFSCSDRLGSMLRLPDRSRQAPYEALGEVLQDRFAHRVPPGPHEENASTDNEKHDRKAKPEHPRQNRHRPEHQSDG